MIVTRELAGPQSSDEDAIAAAQPFPPLRLPLPTSTFSRCDHREPGFHDRGAEIPSASPRHEGARAWYRWLVGHHLAVGVWRLQVDHLATLLKPGCSPAAEAEATHSIAVLYDVYSALLLYSGSCTPESYAAVIRSRMKARHAGFSGTWARDHEQVSLLLAQLRRNAYGGLTEAMRFNRLVHMSIGRRLVPNGRSLLRESGGAPGATTDADRDRFDEFFLIRREDVCRHAFSAVLTDRMNLVLDDVTTTSLDAEYDNDAVRAFQADVPSHLAKLSSLLCEWRAL